MGLYCSQAEHRELKKVIGQEEYLAERENGRKYFNLLKDTDAVARSVREKPKANDHEPEELRKSP